MITKEIVIDNYNKIKSLWDELTNDEISQLENSGLIIKEIEHYTNLFGRGNKYSGKVQVRYTWLFNQTKEIIQVGDWYEIDITEQKVFETLVFGISNTPEVLSLLFEANGGQLPNILPPVAPVIENITPPTETITPPIDNISTPSIVEEIIITGNTENELTGTTETNISGNTENVISGSTENAISGDTENILSGTTENILSGNTENNITGFTENNLSGDTETIIDDNTITGSTEN